MVGGDSAGGNLAAATTLLARDNGPALAGQLLVYPNTRYGANTPSMRTGDDPFLFNRTSVNWYWDHYLTDPCRRSRSARLALARRCPTPVCRRPW